MHSNYILHRNATKENLLDIVKIKSVAWKYSTEEHLKWIEQNICDNDFHILLFNDENLLVAYLNLVEIQFNLNDENYLGYGIGNVCSLVQGRGDGSRLIEITNSFLIENNKIGVLLCKDNLIDFYARSKWKIIPNDLISFKKNNEKISMMIFNYESELVSFYYDGKSF